MNLTNTYWSHTGKHEELATELGKLIPNTGSVSSPRSTNQALERFRKARNCYYDLYNNGLGNRAAEFKSVFDINSKWHKVVGQYGRYFDHLYKETEAAMDEIVLAAAIEQGLVQTNFRAIA